MKKFTQLISGVYFCYQISMNVPQTMVAAASTLCVLMAMAVILVHAKTVSLEVDLFAKV
jgi:hypothetical protein